MKFIPILLAAIALTACSNDETVNESTNDRVALQVTSGIQSRAIGNNWQAGDAIGIYMFQPGTTALSEGNENRKYTTADGNSTFSATPDQIIYFPVSGSSVDFFAYYPHQLIFNEQHQALFDVSDQTKQPEFDLMTAKINSTDETPINKYNPRVEFKFYHRMTRIELNIIDGAGLLPEHFAGMTVEITNQRTECLFDPQFDAMGLNLTPVKTVTMLTAADGLTSSAILLPNSTLNPIIANRQIIFTLKSTGEKFYYNIPNDKEFKSGDRNIYNITVNRSGLSVAATIEDWNKGNGDHGENGSAE